MPLGRWSVADHPQPSVPLLLLPCSLGVLLLLLPGSSLSLSSNCAATVAVLLIAETTAEVAIDAGVVAELCRVMGIMVELSTSCFNDTAGASWTGPM